MKLTRLERAMLASQLRIRQAVTKEDLSEPIEVLEKGYEFFFRDALVGVYEEPLSEDDCLFVIHVLSMYRAIGDWIAANPDDTDIASHHRATFSGFDGNNETAHMCFVQFLVDRQRKFEELNAIRKKIDNFNSHFPTLDMYGSMVDAWLELQKQKKHELTRADVLAILSAGH